MAMGSTDGMDSASTEADKKSNSPIMNLRRTARTTIESRCCHHREYSTNDVSREILIHQHTCSLHEQQHRQILISLGLDIASRDECLPHQVTVIEHLRHALRVLKVCSVGVVNCKVQQQRHVEGVNADAKSFEINAIDFNFWLPCPEDGLVNTPSDIGVRSTRH